MNSETRKNSSDDFISPNINTAGLSSHLNTSDSGEDSYGDSEIILNRSLAVSGLGIRMSLDMDYLEDEGDNDDILPPDLDFDLDFDKLGKRKRQIESRDFDDEIEGFKHLKV